MKRSFSRFLENLRAGRAAAPAPKAAAASLRETAARVWCGLAHRTQWTLYGGFKNPFIYCNHCSVTKGDKASWYGQGVAYSQASVMLRVAAEELAKQEGA